MRKALIITTVSGFVPQFEMNNVKILQELGYEVHYASNFHTPVYGENNDRLKGTEIVCHQIDFVRSPFSVKQNIEAFLQLKQLMKRERFDFVHCHTPMGGVLGRIAGKVTNTRPICYTAHGFHFYRGAPILNWILFYPIERYLARYTDELITITKEDYERAKKFKKILPEHICYIPGVGIDLQENLLEHKSKKGKRPELRERFGISEDQIVYLSVGELNKNKNQEQVISALIPSWNKQIQYFICGKGKQEKKLKEKIKKGKLEEQVHLLGYQENIKEFYEMADVFIISSYREGLSVSLQEAMAAGLLIIASNIRGNVELVVPKKGGWLVSPNKKLQIRQAIWEAEQIILKNPQRAMEMGSFNQEKIKQYQRERIEKRMKKIYQNLSKENRKINKGERK